MSRALTTAGLLAALALAAGAPCAQPVATLEVAPKAGTQHQKLDRIEQKVDLILERLRAAPPVLPPVVQPPKPVEPPPPPPPPPNPFVAWRAQGLSIQDVMLWRLGGRGMTPEEHAQAVAAGYDLERRQAPAGQAPAGEGGDPRAGFDFGVGGGTVLLKQYQAGSPITFTFTMLPGHRRARFAVFGAPGRVFREAWISIDGGPRQAMQGQLDAIIELVDVLGPGQHTASIEVDVASQNGAQFNQWPQ